LTQGTAPGRDLSYEWLVTTRAIVILSLLLGACGDDGHDTADASTSAIDADTTPDSALGDAPVDAFVPCFGKQLFTGEYVDWDSTPMDFHGVPDATAVEVSNASNTATTAPNGRLILCLDNGVNADVEFTQTSYWPLMFSSHAQVTTLGNGYSTKGLTPARATQLASDLGVGTLSGTQVLIEVRNMKTEAPVSGVTVALTGDIVGGAFAMDASRQWSAGNVTIGGGYVLFTNVADAGGTVSLSVTPSGGETCTARASVTLEDGGIAATSVHCE